MLDSPYILGAREERARQERSKLHREADRLRQQSHHEAEPQAQKSQHLIAHEAHDPVKECRHEEYPEHQPDDEICQHQEEMQCNASAAAAAAH